MERIRRKYKLLAAAITLLILFTVVLIMISALRLENVEIKNSTYYSDKKLESLYSIKPGYGNTVLTWLRLKYGSRPNVPFIDDLDIELSGFHTLKIKVYEKNIIGCIPYMGEYVCFDKDGVMVGSIAKRRDDIPVVEGIDYSSMVYNSKVDTDQNDIFRIVLNITQLVDKYDIKVQTISFDSGMNVVLTCGSIFVELGNGSHFDTQISNLPDILKKANGMKGTLHMENFASSGGRVVFEK